MIMKNKILSLVLLVCCLVSCSFFLTGCKDGEEEKFATFTELGAGDTLFVGDFGSFKNYKSTVVEEYYLSFPTLTNVTLLRSSYSNNDYIYYDGYYYYWNVSTTQDNILMGNRTVITSKSYSYLVHGENNSNIVVRTTTKVETKYDFTTGMIEKPCEVVYDLNGYFATINDLKGKTRELYEKLSVRETTKKYVSSPKTTYSYSENTYNNTYFYFD